MAAPSAGAMLTPNIKLERPLARGGMGSVWLADHLGLHTKVVVKFIAEEVAGHPEVIARFEREAAAASQVKSQHVVQMLDHGVSPAGLAYIAMELLEGYSLANHLDTHPLVPPQQVAHVVAQVAKALGRAHEKGVVHRDIKPDNIFLCDGGDGEAFVKVLDFGIAKLTGAGSLETTKTGAMLGTPYYMSPEQVMGAKSLDHRADLWALAVVAYEMLTGCRPFEGETMGAISVRICSTEFESSSTKNPSLTPAIDAFFAQAFARDLDARFTSARTLADSLEHAAGGAKPLSLSGAVSKPAPTTQLPPSSVATGPTGTITATVATPPPNYVPPPQPLATGLGQAAPAPSMTPGRKRTIAFVAAGALAFAAGITLFLLRPHVATPEPSSPAAKPSNGGSRSAGGNTEEQQAASAAKSAEAAVSASAQPPTPSASAIKAPALAEPLPKKPMPPSTTTATVAPVTGKPITAKPAATPTKKNPSDVDFN